MSFSLDEIKNMKKNNERLQLDKLIVELMSEQAVINREKEQKERERKAAETKSAKLSKIERFISDFPKIAKETGIKHRKLNVTEMKDLFFTMEKSYSVWLVGSGGTCYGSKNNAYISEEGICFIGKKKVSVSEMANHLYTYGNGGSEMTNMDIKAVFMSVLSGNNPISCGRD